MIEAEMLILFGNIGFIALGGLAFYLTRSGMTSGSEKRFAEFDFLRIIASIGVVFSHSHARWLYTPIFNSFIPIRMFTSSGNAIFAFLSAFLFTLLDKHKRQDFSVKNHYKMIFWKLYLPYLSWGTLYVFGEYFGGKYLYGRDDGFSLVEAFEDIFFFRAITPFWFFQMIIIVYLLLPLTRISLIKRIKYYILVALIGIQVVYTYNVFILGFNFIDHWVLLLGSKVLLSEAGNALIVNSIKYIISFIGYVGFALLFGSKYRSLRPHFAKMQWQKITLILIILVFYDLYLTFVQIQTNVIDISYYPIKMPFVMLYIFALVLIGIRLPHKFPKLRFTLSQITYGIYLTHTASLMIVAHIIENIILSTNNQFLESYIMIPLIFIVSSINSVLLSYLIKLSPIALTIGLKT